VYQLNWVPACGDHVKPAPRYHHFFGQAQYAIGDRIPMVMVVKQPSVDIALAQSSLNGRKVHGQTTILNKSSSLGECKGMRYIRLPRNCDVIQRGLVAEVWRGCLFRAFRAQLPAAEWLSSAR